MHTDENEQSKQSRVTGRGEKAWNQKIRYFASICWCLGDPKSRPFLPAGLKCRLKICERLACICELCACKQPLCPPVTRATKIEYDCGYRRKIWNPSATPTVHGQTDKKKNGKSYLYSWCWNQRGVWTAVIRTVPFARNTNTVDWPKWFDLGPLRLIVSDSDSHSLIEQTNTFSLHIWVFHF